LNMPNRMTRKLGKLAPVIDHRTLKLAKYKPVLPTPPLAVDWTKKAAQPWGMMLNDTIGDCTCAAAGHALQTWTGNAGHPSTSLDQAILKAYKACGGYDGTPNTDNGAAMLTVLKYWRKTGICDRKIGAFVSVNPRSLAEVLFAIWHFEGVYMGLALPDSAQNQDVWDVPASGVLNGPGVAGSWGGHAIWTPKYQRPNDRLWCITWGREQPMTMRFLQQYCDEMYAVVSQDMLDSTGRNPQGEGLAELNADLAKL
jgi:hypothetical protein